MLIHKMGLLVREESGVIEGIIGMVTEEDCAWYV